MRLLLDTHALLWFIGGSDRLSASAKSLIEDSSNDKLVSVVSIWEMAIKVSLGKMKLSTSFDDLFPKQIITNGFEMLPVQTEHTSIVARLPFHHRDPFDRMLIAQAKSENATLISVDRQFDSYNVNRVW